MRDISDGGQVPAETGKMHEKIKEDEKAIEEEIERVDIEDKLEDAEEKEENSEPWDGTEAEFVEDDEAMDYEESYPGIKLSYTIKKEEIIECLRYNSDDGVKGARQIMELGLLVVLAVAFLVSFFITGNTLNLILSLVSAALIVLTFVAPIISIRVGAGRMATAKKMDVEIFHDNIVITSGPNEWEIPLNGTVEMTEHENMIMIFIPRDRIFVIPVRAIDPDFLPDVQAMLIAGTTPREK